MKFLRSKRGSELLEASLVLPLLILMIASLIGAGAFVCEHFRSMVLTQEQLLLEVEDSNALYGKMKKGNDSSSDIKGAFRGVLSREYTVTARTIDEAAIVRAGGILGLGKEEAKTSGESGEDEEEQ